MEALKDFKLALGYLAVFFLGGLATALDLDAHILFNFFGLCLTMAVRFFISVFLIFKKQ